MRKLLLLLWLALPVAALAYHMGPGQDRLRIDDASDLVEAGERHAAKAGALACEGDELAAASEWGRAEAAFEEALSLLPAERVAERRALRVEHAKARMFVSELPEANAELEDLVLEMEADADADPAVLREARRALAHSQYYLTWLMRLEGRTREEWEPPIESARQLFKLIADDSQGEEQSTAREDLEAAVRLARLELSELQGLPLPSQ